MRNLLERKNIPEYFDTEDQFVVKNLGKCIIKQLQRNNILDCTPIILCIGTDRATGDCLGPLVGEQLMDYSETFKVMGCLCAPVHALNLHDAIKDIYDNHENPFVIAVDAALGARSHVGYITLSDGPIVPGKGVQKKLPAIGNLSITGIVNVSGQHSGLLQTTRLYTVMQLANCIADALKYSIHTIENY